jgi:hypothetical protein
LKVALTRAEQDRRREERLGGPSGNHDDVFHDDGHVLRTPTKLLDDASSAHRKLDPAGGLQDAQLDNGARVHIVYGDVASIWHVPLDQVIERREPGLCAGPALDRVRRPSRRRQDDA